jgi:hypothetical protein
VSVKLSAYVWDGCAAAGIKGNKLLIMLRLADYASDEGSHTQALRRLRASSAPGAVPLSR